MLPTTTSSVRYRKAPKVAKMVCSNDGYLKSLVRRTRSLLEAIGGAEVLQEELDYYRPSRLRLRFLTIGPIHVRLCDSIRNASRMRLVITDRYSEAIANHLLAHSLDSICNGGVKLVTEIVRDSCQLSEDAQNEKRSWGIFKQGVVDSACYLKKFKDSKEFYSYIDSNTDTADQAWNLALKLDLIKGIGPPLACDFLKEIGVDKYGKPDLHIKDTFAKLRLISEDKQDREAFEVLWRMGELTGYSTAVVDKIFWMAASGRWDKTLDERLTQDQKRLQNLRKQCFDTLLDIFLYDPQCEMA